MNTLGGALLGLAFGFGSALLPILNAETYAVASAGGVPWMVVPVILALALGQTAGKLVLFEAARRGSTRFQATPKTRALVSGRWSVRLRRAFRSRRTAIPMVLGSAGLGLPPLALVSVAAGAAGQSRRVFALVCFLGRTARFSALAVPIAFAVSSV